MATIQTPTPAPSPQAQPATPPEMPHSSSENSLSLLDVGHTGQLVPESKAENMPSHSSSNNSQATRTVGSTEQITWGDLRDLLKDFISRDSPSAIEPAGLDENKEHHKRVLASKLEYKTVNEIWDEKAYEYKIVDSAPSPDVGELDECTFVVRKRVDKKTGDDITYIDIKSPTLRDFLRPIFRDVRIVSLEAERPTIERHFLFHFLPELKAHLSLKVDSDEHSDRCISELRLLTQHLEDVFQPTFEKLSSLLERREITYDVLWTYFKPGILVYMDCPSTGLPRCARLSFGLETQTDRKIKCFEIQGEYLDFDGEVFGESTETVQINIFQGARRIESLPVYPLHFHPDPAIRSRLVLNGRKFTSLMSCHHRQYHGNMFIPNKGALRKFHVKGRIMIDAKSFRTCNPDYPRFVTNKPRVFDMFGEVPKSTSVDRIRYSGMDIKQMTDSDLMRCSPSLLGFSLTEKLWGEFAVESIEEIQFSPSPFNRIAIPENKKKVIKSVVESYMSMVNGTNDVIAGKGQGVIILLQGPPGVGKTLTAETIAEQLQRPLYSISAGQLAEEAEQLEFQLTQVFDTAASWKAILLLDEADVYLQQRDSLQLHRNRLVGVFLHKLEYYNGVLFLTTNRPQDFDNAVLDRIPLKLQYGNLDLSARREVFTSFLGEENKIEEKDLDSLAKPELNGRQIKNVVNVARNIALSDGATLSAGHIRMALRINGISNNPPDPSKHDNSIYDG